jgi:Mrr restriction endonuclease-like protein
MTRNLGERQTPRKNFRKPVLQALVDTGGSVTRKDDILPLVEARMMFVSADLALRPDGSPKWVRVVGYVIGDLRKDGLVEPAARNGIKITGKGREYCRAQ